MRTRHVLKENYSQLANIDKKIFN